MKHSDLGLSYDAFKISNGALVFILGGGAWECLEKRGACVLGCIVFDFLSQIFHCYWKNCAPCWEKKSGKIIFSLDNFWPEQYAFEYRQIFDKNRVKTRVGPNLSDTLKHMWLYSSLFKQCYSLIKDKCLLEIRISNWSNFLCKFSYFVNFGYQGKRIQ